jgi:hypothetical protein
MSRFTRIKKLESRRRGDNEMLMLWRKPGQESEAVVLAAKSAGLFGPGDLVVCAEWFGEDNLPAPRWIRHFETDLTEIENEYCDRTIDKLISKDQPKSTGRNHDYDHISTDQLTYICLAVET